MAFNKFSAKVHFINKLEEIEFTNGFHIFFSIKTNDNEIHLEYHNKKLITLIY